MTVHIYLDESGDTGWRFDHPYTKGGSSRHLIIAACLLPPDVEHMPERMLRHMYKRRGWSAHSEKKWAQMSPDARGEFASNAAKLVIKNPGIELHAIVVAKQNVKQHIQRDPNKLYNYMVKLLLLDQMAKHEQVSFVPDPRSIKVESGSSLHDYLQTELWFSRGSTTRLETIPRDSQHCLNLQFTDMVAGVVQSYFEFGQTRYWDVLSAHIRLETLFFEST